MIAVLSVLWALADPAEPAAEAPPLSLVFEGCGERPSREIERLLRADVSWAPGDPTMVVTFRCQAGGIAVALTSDDNPVGDRLVSLPEASPANGDGRGPAAAQNALPRAVALIAAEMILLAREQGAEVTLPPSPRATVPMKTTAASTPLPDDAPAAISPRDRSSPAAVTGRRPPVASHPLAVLGLAGLSSHRASPGAPLFEAGARLRWEREARWDMSLDAVASLERQTVTLGTALALGAGLSLLAEARAALGRGWVRAGVGARTMALRLSATTTATDVKAASSAWGASAGPMARLGISWFWSGTVADLFVDGGWYGPDVAGNVAGASVVGIGGLWGGLSVALGWAEIGTPR